MNPSEPNCIIKSNLATPTTEEQSTVTESIGDPGAEQELGAVAELASLPVAAEIFVPTLAAALAPAASLSIANFHFKQDDTDEVALAKVGECQTLTKRGDKLLKHPLQNVWTLWYLENDRTKSWEDMQNEITSFDTVEDFWSLYNHIKPPSEIKLGSDYSLFKKDIRPMWEDAANNNGGRWVITLSKLLKDDLDKLWLDVLLCLIGEVFDHLDQVCGAVVNIRGKSNKISIWTSNGNNQEAILEIGHKLRDALRLSPQNVLQYQLHKDTMVKQGSNIKSTYTL